MIEKYLRPYYQIIFINPLLRLLSNRVSANSVSLLAGCLGILVVPAIISGYNMAAVGLLLLSGFCDTLDGSLARHQNNPSSWGTVLDIMIDRLVEFMVILALFLVAPEQRGIYCLLMLGSILLCVTSFLVVGIFSENDSHKSFHYSPGIIERAEAFFFFILMILVPSYFSILASIFILLVTATALIRLHQFRLYC